MSDRPFQIFEISWEVCNKVGGIYTVLTSKAKTAVEQYGDDYFCVGPQLAGAGQQPPFEEESGHEEFIESCRKVGLPVRIGRWRIAGRPRCILIGFSSLYAQKDGVLAGLWERHQVDSIAGDWDYVEPVLFATAAAMVIERWWEEYLAPYHRRAIVQAHEWMTGAALLYLRERIPSIGTVFTTHATMLGRSLASLGIDPSKGLGDKTSDELAQAHGVRAKHSLEGACARKSDVFTTVSEITAAEAEILHGRKATMLLPNGIDLDVVDHLVGDDRTAMRAAVAKFAGEFLGEDVGDAAFLALAGRYEFHNKGIELLLDAIGKMQDKPGRRVVVFLLVPAGNSGIRGELLERQRGVKAHGPIGICTHNVFDEERDPVQQHCKRLGIDNHHGARVKVVQLPIYFRPDDGIFGREYEAVLAAMDVGVYPSFYEPWGYTPQEALAVGIPTITTDLAGFGRWAKEAGVGPADGITVLARQHVPYADVTTALVNALERYLCQQPADAVTAARCRLTAERTSWKDLFANYRNSYALSITAVQQRSTAGIVQFRLPRRALPSPGSGTTPRLALFEAAATVPTALRGLDRLARNFWWSWNPGVKELFLALSPEFSLEGESPVRCLQNASLDVLQRLAADKDYLLRLQAAVDRLEHYLATGPVPILAGSDGAGKGGAAIDPQHPIAYFSAEFGVHPSLPIYSGGLGILAGDHLKSASDLGIPLCGVGLFYRCGYIGQQLSSDGQQAAIDRENDPRQLAVEAVRSADGRPIEITVPMQGRDIALRAFKAMVGRVPLYLLDANCPQNRPEDRDITKNLYGGETETRIQQEIVLGRGGVILLRTMGLSPCVYHMNEGHAAFLVLERLSRLVRGEGITFEAAREYIAETTLFTTHTPVPAGHDRFSEDLVRRYFGNVEEWVGMPWDRFFALGVAGTAREFNMTYLALNFANFVNGVAKLHRLASQQLLLPFWPGLLQKEVPVTSVTNGVHLPTWTHDGVADLLRKGDEPVRPSDFAAAAGIDRNELWQVHHGSKLRMIEAVRASLTRSFHARGDSPVLLGAMLAGLDEDALYLGFARRFAPYKRATLLFTDPARLRQILAQPGKQVRIVVSGKAHPRDKLGQDLLKHIVQLTRSPEFIGRVFFIEDYDIGVARSLVRGVDVWVNTPTRMEEASGTSGMKAAANGVLNLSIADGWWPEAADGKNGFTIGAGQVYSDPELQNQADATALYRLLEDEIVPAFFTRNSDGLPDAWLDAMVHCLQTIPPMFNTDRMVREYCDLAYRPLAQRYFVQQAANKAPARERGKEIARIRNAFPQVKIVAANMSDLQDFKVGQHLDVHMDIEVGALTPGDLVVELIVGRIVGAELADLTVVALKHLGSLRAGVEGFEGSFRVERAGRYSHGLRVRARVPNQAAMLRGLVLWA